MIVAGLRALGMSSPISLESRGVGAITRAFSNLLGSVRGLGGNYAAFGTGLLTGLLPCGLSWSAFALATQLSAPTAFLGLFLFGLGTAPLLVLVAFGWVTLKPEWRRPALRIAALLLIGFGMLTITRGSSLFHDSTETKAGWDCCSDSASETLDP